MYIIYVMYTKDQSWTYTKVWSETRFARPVNARNPQAYCPENSIHVYYRYDCAVNSKHFFVHLPKFYHSTVRSFTTNPRQKHSW